MPDRPKPPRKPSLVHPEPLNELEAAQLRSRQVDPAGYVALVISGSAVSVKTGHPDGLATLSVSFLMPEAALVFLDGQIALPLVSNPMANRSFRKALGSRPLVRLTIRRDQLRLPANVLPSASVVNGQKPRAARAIGPDRMLPEYIDAPDVMPGDKEPQEK